MALQFTAVNSTGDEAKAGTDGSVRALTAAKDSVVTFKLEADAAIDSPSITRQESAQPIQVEFEIAADQKSATAEYTVTEFGTFVASAKVGGAQTSGADVVRLNEAAPPSANGSQSENDKPSELEVGEFDRDFALQTLIVPAVISVAIVAGIWSVISRVLLPAPGALIPPDQVVDGTFGQRAAFIVLVIGAGVGGITLAIGAWLAAIETRGRLRANLQGKDAGKGDGAGVAAAELAEVANIIDKARRLRGSMAVVVAGFLIVALSMWGVRPMASTPEMPSPTPSATATPSVTAAPTPSESPSAGQPSPDGGSMTPTPVPTPTG